MFFRPSEDLPPGDDRPGARSGTRGCGAIRVLRLLQEGETPELRSLSFPTKAPIQPYKSWFSDLCEGYGDEHAYYNWFIYPNVNFCSVRGEHFLLQQIRWHPARPTTTCG